MTSTRFYCDTWDEHFWTAPDPDREGVVVAAGGSGHGFKFNASFAPLGLTRVRQRAKAPPRVPRAVDLARRFAPVLGGIIADAVEGRVMPKFRWRPEVRPERGEEAARARE